MRKSRRQVARTHLQGMATVNASGQEDVALFYRPWSQAQQCATSRESTQVVLSRSRLIHFIWRLLSFFWIYFSIYHWPKAPVSTIWFSNATTSLFQGPLAAETNGSKSTTTLTSSQGWEFPFSCHYLPPRHCPFTLFICLRTHFGLSFATWEEAFDEQ